MQTEHPRPGGETICEESEKICSAATRAEPTPRFDLISTQRERERERETLHLYTGLVSPSISRLSLSLSNSLLLPISRSLDGWPLRKRGGGGDCAPIDTGFMEPLGRHGRKEGEGSRCHSLLSQCNAILTTDNASFVTVAGIHGLWKEGEGSRRVERKSLERVCVCVFTWNG